MASIRVVRPGGKWKVLTREKRLSRQEFEAVDLNGRVEMIRSLVGIGLVHVFEELDREVVALAGERYARKDEQVTCRRHGTNPGTVRLAGQQIGIEVPRVRGPRCEVSLPSYESFGRDGDLNETQFRRVLSGISCRDYEAAGPLAIWCGRMQREAGVA